MSKTMISNLANLLPYTTMTTLLKLWETHSRSWIGICTALNRGLLICIGILSSYNMAIQGHFSIVSFNKKNVAVYYGYTTCTGEFIKVYVQMLYCDSGNRHKESLPNITHTHTHVTCLQSVIRCINTFCYHDVMSLIFMCTLCMTHQPTFLKEKIGLRDHYTALSVCSLFNLQNSWPIYTQRTNFMPLNMPSHVTLLHKFLTPCNNNVTHVGTAAVLSKETKPRNLITNLCFMPFKIC